MLQCIIYNKGGVFRACLSGTPSLPVTACGAEKPQIWMYVHILHYTFLLLFMQTSSLSKFEVLGALSKLTNFTLVSRKNFSVWTRLKMNYLSGKKDVVVKFCLVFLGDGWWLLSRKAFHKFIQIFLIFLLFRDTKNNELYNDSIWWGDFQKQYFFLAHCFYIFLLKAFLKTEAIYALSFFYCFGWIYIHQF